MSTEPDTKAERLKAARASLATAEWALANLDLSARAKAVAIREAAEARAAIEEAEAAERTEETP